MEGDTSGGADEDGGAAALAVGLESVIGFTGHIEPLANPYVRPVPRDGSVFDYKFVKQEASAKGNKRR